MSIRYRLEKIAELSRNQEIDRAMDRANLGTVGRRVAGAINPYAALVPAATIASGYGVEDPQLQAAIRDRTLLAGTAGALLGAVPGAIGMSRARNLNQLVGYGALTAAGGTLGEVAGQRLGLSAMKDNEKVAEYSAIADMAQSGQFGEEVQYAFEGMTSAIASYVDEEIPEKTASHPETDYTIYDENAARVARLETLLRK